MPLKGVRVLELAGLAPAPFCGMLLADFGATVMRIDRMLENPLDCLGKGKQTIALNMKHEKGQEIIRKLSNISDVVIEPYRPGVMENLNLGPDVLLRENPRLIYARLSGFGQTGPLAKRAGHDINYVALSGVLSMLGRSGEPPSAPINLIADFAGGGLLCALGICMALLERHRSNAGQVIDCSMSEGAAYVGSWLTRSQKLPIWGHPRGYNMLDGGAFYYTTYETSDGKYMSVGAIEPQFFREFTRLLELDNIDQFDDNSSVEVKRRIENIFKTKTQEQWTRIFEHNDACVYPVLDWKNANEYSHNQERAVFVDKKFTDGDVVPTPAPKLSRTPGVSGVLKADGDYMTHIGQIFKEIDLNEKDIWNLCEEGVLTLPTNAKL